jgi:transcriptional regulator with XRE-family HTH domain
MNNLPEVLKKLREQYGLTQKQVAEAVNISTRAYGFYETGDRQPNLDTLINLAELFKVPLDILVGRYVDPGQPAAEKTQAKKKQRT